ncbi:MAG: T9SS type A sorting domain-containing protein, partial [Saprospiraceae bacterium]
LLDSTFSADGKVTTSFPSASVALVNALIIQPDQKIVAVGTANGNKQFAVARYLPDGSLDAGFGNSGLRLIDFGAGDDLGQSALLQSDGKIVIAGSAHANFALARLLENGDLDSTFGVNGRQTTQIGPGESAGFSVALQADGQLVVAGTAYLSSNQGVVALARYDAQGQLDPSFGSGGIVLSAIDSLDDHAEAVAIQSDGKIIVAGYAMLGGQYDFALARYNPDGSRDTTFGTQGQRVTDFTGFNDYGRAITLQLDGKILVTGTTTAGTTIQSIALARYNADGNPDATFGVNGKTKFNLNGVSDNGKAITVQADGKIIVAGYTYIPIYQVYRFALLRLLPTGVLDPSFNGNGVVTTPFQVGNDQAYAVVLQADGRIVAGGHNSSNQFALARYLNGEIVETSIPPFSSQPILLYPNPVAESATIIYTLRQPEPVSVFLYDQSGKLVSRIMTEAQQAAGRQEQTFLLPDPLPSGLYYLVLSTPKGQTSLRLVK